MYHLLTFEESKFEGKTTPDYSHFLCSIIYYIFLQISSEHHRNLNLMNNEELIINSE